MARTQRRTKVQDQRRMNYMETEFGFYEMLERIEAEKVERGRFVYMVKWYHLWTLNCETYEQYKQKKAARYHGEQRSGYYSPPSEYVNLNFNRPYRRRIKEQMHYALTYDLWDDTALEPHVKCAGYYWF